MHAQSPQQKHPRGPSLHNMTAATAALLCISAARERITEEEEEVSPSIPISQQPLQPVFASDDSELQTIYRNATVVPQPNPLNEENVSSPQANPSFPSLDRPSDLLVRRRFSDSGLLVHTNAAQAAAIAARLRLRGHNDNENTEFDGEDGQCTCGHSPSFNPIDGTNANTTVNNTRAPSPSEHGMRSYVASVSTSPCGRFGVESADVSRRTSPSANNASVTMGSTRQVPPAAPSSSSGRKVFTFDGPLLSFYENIEKKHQEQEKITEESLDLAKTPPTGGSHNPLYAYGSPATRTDKSGNLIPPVRHFRELSRVTEFSGVSSDKAAEDQWAVRLRTPMPDAKTANKELLGAPTPSSTHDFTTPEAGHVHASEAPDATWHRVQPPANLSDQQRTNYTYLTGMDEHDWSLLVKMYRNMPPTV